MTTAQGHGRIHSVHTAEYMASNICSNYKKYKKQVPINISLYLYAEIRSCCTLQWKENGCTKGWCHRVKLVKHGQET